MKKTALSVFPMTKITFFLPIQAAPKKNKSVEKRHYYTLFLWSIQISQTRVPVLHQSQGESE